MSFSIDDIWDEPVASGSAPQAQIQTQAHGAEHDDDVATRPSPAKRRRTTLFLSSDSEDGNSPQRKTQPLLIPNKAPPRTPKRADIEALFEDLDDDDELADERPVGRYARRRDDEDHLDGFDEDLH